MAYLDDHTSAVVQQRKPRRGPIRLIVKHTTEQVPDLVGPDSGAENLASAILRSGRQASYHRIDDRDSVLRFIEDGNEAFGARGGYNAVSLHSAFALQSASWSALSVRQRMAYLAPAAQADADWARQYGIDVRLITKAEADAGRTGFIGHGHLDPSRRTDPGWDDAAWEFYLGLVRSAMTSTPPVTFVPVPSRYWPKQGRAPLWDVYPDGRIIPIDGAPATEQLTDYGVARPDHPITDAWFDQDLAAVVLYSEVDRGRFALRIR